MTDCAHEAPPFPEPGPSGFVEREYSLNPAGLQSIVPCVHCGAPLNRGRYSGYLIDPDWAREHGIPTDKYSES